MSKYTKINYKLWKVLLIITGVGSLFLVFLSLSDILTSLRYSKKVEAKTINFRVIETKNEMFKIHLEYTYLLEGKVFSKEETINNVVFNNPYQAEKVIQETKNKEWFIWYRNHHPEIATIQKEFSIKKLVQAFLGIGVFLYFLFAKEFQTQKDRNNFLKQSV